jgi:hypothetical protein
MNWPVGDNDLAARDHYSSLSKDPTDQHVKTHKYHLEGIFKWLILLCAIIISGTVYDSAVKDSSRQEYKGCIMGDRIISSGVGYGGEFIPVYFSTLKNTVQ